MRIEIQPGVRLFVDVQSTGWEPDGASLRQKPTLLCLHGGPGFDHSAFRPYFHPLADICQIIYYDHRGHGRSDPCAATQWTLEQWADDVVRLCDALGVEKPIVLGQSFGGFVAQHYLARHPGHAGKIILSSTSPHLGLQRKVAAMTALGGAAAGEAVRAFWSRPSAQTWNSYFKAARHLYNTTPQDAQAAERAIKNLDILFHFARGELPRMNLLPGLARAQCPVLVMAGECDPVCPLPDSLDIYAAVPARWRQMARFAGAGHGVWRDDKAAALAVLRRFIQAENGA